VSEALDLACRAFVNPGEKVMFHQPCYVSYHPSISLVHGQGIAVPTFAKDGEEAIRVLESEKPKLIVLSSVVPKISTTELIRAIRGRKLLQETPILLTVSGYNGKSPKSDAQRVGASDILPKPYSESEFLGKVQQMLGIPAGATLTEEFAVRPTVTSNDLFADLRISDYQGLEATKHLSLRELRRIVHHMLLNGT